MTSVSARTPNTEASASDTEIVISFDKEVFVCIVKLLENGALTISFLEVKYFWVRIRYKYLIVRLI